MWYIGYHNQSRITPELYTRITKQGTASQPLTTVQVIIVFTHTTENNVSYNLCVVSNIHKQCICLPKTAKYISVQYII